MQPKQNPILTSIVNQKPIMDESKKVKFNIGGRKYETTIKTLRRFPQSFLARLIDQPKEAFLIENDQEIFIDRDPTYFEDILNYYRNADDFDFMPIIKHNSNLLIETKFYQLPGFCQSIKKRGNRGGMFQKIFGTFNRKEGENVKFDSEAIKNLKTIIHLAANKNYICWECHESFDSTWPDKSIQIEWARYEGILLVGKIDRVRGKCAEVKFPWNMLRDAITDRNGDEKSGKLSNDEIVKIHIPLACLEKEKKNDYFTMRHREMLEFAGQHQIFSAFVLVLSFAFNVFLVIMYKMY